MLRILSSKNSSASSSTFSSSFRLSLWKSFLLLLRLYSRLRLSSFLLRNESAIFLYTMLKVNGAANEPRTRIERLEISHAASYTMAAFTYENPGYHPFLYILASTCAKETGVKFQASTPTSKEKAPRGILPLSGLNISGRVACE